MKNLKLSGIVLLVAGLSIAAISCSKVAPVIDPEDGMIVDGTIIIGSTGTPNFASSLQGPEQVVAVSSDSVSIAIEEILENLKKEFEKAGQAHNDAVDSLHVDLFRTLTSFCGYHKFDKFYFKDRVGLYKAWYKLLIGKKDEYSYIRLSSKNRRLSLETITGYYIRIDLPAWAAVFFEKDGEFDYKTKEDDVYCIEIGKRDRIYAQTVIDTNEEKVLTFVYDTNAVAVAGSCWVKDGVDSLDYLWYNNTEVAGDHPTSIRIYDVDILNKDLALMKSEFTYTEAEANAIVDEFNGNVTIDAVSPLCASLCGLEFKAVVDGPTQAGFYRAILKWGDQFVPAQEVTTFVEEWLKRVLEKEM